MPIRIDGTGYIGSANNIFTDGSGNVGIGNSSPTASAIGKTLEVTGCITTSGPINSHQTSKGVFEYNSNKIAIRAYGSTSGSGYIAFNVGGGAGSADFEAVRIDAGGRVGIGTASPTANLHIYTSSKTSFKMTGGIADSDINQRHICQIDNIYTWTTLLSITPSTVGATWMRGFVKCSISCHNSGNGNGALIDAIWYLDLNGGSGATTAQVSAGTSSGSWPGQFRVNMSGSTWQLQVQATNTVNRFDGVAMFDILLSHGAGTAATYTIG